MDTIFIHELQVPVVIGVFPEERTQTQTLLLDLETSFDISDAANSDELSKTIDYSVLCQSILEFVSTTQFQLIETLAEKIAQHLKDQFNLSQVRLKLTKRPIDMQDVDCVGVEIQR